MTKVDPDKKVLQITLATFSLHAYHAIEVKKVSTLARLVVGMNEKSPKGASSSLAIALWDFLSPVVPKCYTDIKMHNTYQDSQVYHVFCSISILSEVFINEVGK